MRSMVEGAKADRVWKSGGGTRIRPPTTSWSPSPVSLRFTRED